MSLIHISKVVITADPSRPHSDRRESLFHCHRRLEPRPAEELEREVHNVPAYINQTLAGGGRGKLSQALPLLVLRQLSKGGHLVRRDASEDLKQQRELVFFCFYHTYMLFS